MSFRLFDIAILNRIKQDGFKKQTPDLARPTLVGRYAFKLEGNRRCLVQNPDQFVLHYSLVKLNEGETLDLQIKDSERIPNDQEILKTDGTTAIFLEHILANQDLYKSKLKESVDQFGPGAFVKSSTHFQKKTRLLNTDFVCLRGVLCNLM